MSRSIHVLAPAAAHRWTRGLRSAPEGACTRMGDFTEAMTVRQLIDLVAFVHAHTEVQTMAAAR